MERLESLSRTEVETLRRWRQRFLAGMTGGDYWSSPADLALYDRTLAQRIGWKWDAVLRELSARGWRPRSRVALDWGCGSGVAGRRVLAHWPGQIEELNLQDSSRVACAFARAKATADNPGVRVHSSGSFSGQNLVLLSHVLNELTTSQLEALVERLRGVEELIWVEAGTRENSRRLGAEVRERLIGEGGFSVVAPCPHHARCGMLVPDNERHWCHSFAKPPRAIFQDASWMQLGRELGIDLRSTPYAFLVLQRGAARAEEPALGTPPGAARVIGRPRDYKGYSKMLSCETCGVQERMLQKRDAPELLRAVQEGPAAPVYRWELERGRIVGGGVARFPDAPAPGRAAF